VRILRMRPLGIGVETRWITAFWTSLFLMLSLLVQAQNYCIDRRGASLGGFTLAKDKVCVNDPVVITSVPSSLSNVGYEYNYNGIGLASSYTNNLNHVYTTPGSYTIIQVGSGGNGTIYCKEVTVLPVDPVKFTAKGCSGRQALVNVTLDANTSQYEYFIINWGDGQNSNPISRTDIVNPQTHTYANNTTYTITITGAYGAAGCSTPAAAVNSTKQTVSFTATTTPVITKLTTVSDNSISIQYQSSAGANVQLLQKDASGNYSNTGQTGSGSGTFTVQTDTKQVQCFQLAYQDACGNLAGNQSDKVCSLVLDVKAANKENDLSWQPYAGSTSANSTFRTYRIYRGNSPIGSVANQNTTSYVDNNGIECGVQYCYKLEATIGQTIVTSGQVCVTGINDETPGELKDIVVSVEDNHPRIIATLPTTGSTSSYTIVVSRATSPTGPFEVVGTTNKNTFVDESADVNSGAYCYQLAYQSNCGHSSPPSQPVCTVFLSAQSSSGIDWTVGSPFTPDNVASYSLEIIDSTNNTKKEISMGGNTHYEPDPNDPNLQSQRYRVIAVSSTGVVSYSNFFTFRREPKIFVPDAFTPNGDGMNDTFVIKGLYVDQFRMIVYDRWGEVVYSTTDRTQGWDGTIKGYPANKGQYMYQIEVVDLTNQKTVRTGAVLLLR